MTFSFKNSFNNSIKSSLIILKLVIPIYILADLLFYYNILESLSFIFSPITSFLNLPNESAMAIITGIFLNLYAAIAFAAPLGLTPKEWTIMGVFLGICHAMIVETAIMKKLGISVTYSIFLRTFVGLLVAYLVSLLPNSLFSNESILNFNTPVINHYNSLKEMLIDSLLNSLYLSMQIILLITIIIFILDYIKSLEIVQKYSSKVNSSFSITIGVVLGITYGAGILINEFNKGNLKQKDILYIGTFLMIAHSLIEDPLLFVIFGANLWIIISSRLIFAIIISYLATRFIKAKKNEK